METIVPLAFSAIGFILAMASRPGCYVARLFDQIEVWIHKFF